MEFRCNLKERNDLVGLTAIVISMLLLVMSVASVGYGIGINNGKQTSSQCLGFAQVKTMQGGIIYAANPNLLTCKLFLNDESAWKQCIGAGKK